MKTLAFATVALCSLMGSAFAQLPSQPTPNTTTRDNGAVRDGFALSKDGQVMVTRDGATQSVVQEFILTDGSHLFPNGDIIYFTGARDHLRANQLLTLDGMMLDTRVSSQGVVPVYPPGARKDPVVGISSQDGITVSGNDALITRNGVTEKISKRFQLAGGVVVNPDGSFVTRDGKSLTLRENQVLGFDGVLRESRIHETVPSTAAPLASPGNTNR